MAISRIGGSQTSIQQDDVYISTTAIETGTIHEANSLSAGRWILNVTSSGTFANTKLTFIDDSFNTIQTLTATANNTDYEFFVSTIPTKVVVLIATGGSGTFTIQMNKQASSLPVVTATLEVLTTSQTYTETGTAYVGVIGAGGGGGGVPYFTPSYGGGGGGAGYLTKQLVTLSGSTPVVIGAGGTAGTPSPPSATPATNGSAGGTTTFGPLSAAGGGGGPAGQPSGPRPGGAGSSNGGLGQLGPQGPGSGSRDGAASGVSLEPLRVAGQAPGGIYASGRGGAGNGAAAHGGGGGTSTNNATGAPGGVFILRW